MLSHLVYFGCFQPEGLRKEKLSGGRLDPQGLYGTFTDLQLCVRLLGSSSSVFVVVFVEVTLLCVAVFSCCCRFRKDNSGAG